MSKKWITILIAALFLCTSHLVWSDDSIPASTFEETIWGNKEPLVSKNHSFGMSIGYPRAKIEITETDRSFDTRDNFTIGINYRYQLTNWFAIGANFDYMLLTSNVNDTDDITLHSFSLRPGFELRYPFAMLDSVMRNESGTNYAYLYLGASMGLDIIHVQESEDDEIPSLAADVYWGLQIFLSDNVSVLGEMAWFFKKHEVELADGAPSTTLEMDDGLRFSLGIRYHF